MTHASRSRRYAFRRRRLAKSGWRRRALVATALSLWRRAHFRTRRSLFVAGARGPRVWAVQIRLFVTGGAVLLRNASAVNRSFWTGGPLADSWQAQHFANLEVPVQISRQAQHFVCRFRGRHSAL